MKRETIAALLRAGRPDLAVLVGRQVIGVDVVDAIDDEEAVAIETPTKYRNRTNRCPPGYRSNEKKTCIDMKERRKRQRWEKQQRMKERREAGR